MVEPYDERRIGTDDTIIRRISPSQHVVFDGNRGCNRISSKAFSASSGPNAGMSVDIEKLMVEASVEPTDFVTTPEYVGSVAFAAVQLRDLNLRIGYEPIQANPYHGEVWPDEGRNRFRKGQVNGMRNAAVWYVEILGVEIR